MIEPSVGRIVHFFFASGASEHAAIVVGVHDERCVNLAVFNDDGSQYPALEVPLLQDDDAPPAQGPYAAWMAFQKGQAPNSSAVTERLEKLEGLLAEGGAVHGMFGRLLEVLDARFGGLQAGIDRRLATLEASVDDRFVKTGDYLQTLTGGRPAYSGGVTLPQAAADAAPLAPAQDPAGQQPAEGEAGSAGAVVSTVAAIARVCHEVNRAYCESQGDHSQPSWEQAPEWQRKSAVDGVLSALANPDAKPSDQHRSWLAEKAAQGWTYGAEKDPIKKTHPCFVHYDELPPAQKAKDYLFLAVVRAMSDPATP